MLSAVDLPRRRQRAFTLLEISIVVFLILLLLAVGIPSMSGQLSRQRLQGTFDRFDAFAISAQKRSIAEKRAYALVWSRDGTIGLYPADLSTDERKKNGPTATFSPAGSSTARDEHYALVRMASLAYDPANVWTFWPTGNCEPVEIRYEGPSGQWKAAYNPLSATATMHSFIAR